MPAWTSPLNQLLEIIAFGSHLKGLSVFLSFSCIYIKRKYMKKTHSSKILFYRPKSFWFSTGVMLLLMLFKPYFCIMEILWNEWRYWKRAIWLRFLSQNCDEGRSLFQPWNPIKYFIMTKQIGCNRPLQILACLCSYICSLELTIDCERK